MSMPRTEAARGTGPLLLQAASDALAEYKCTRRNYLALRSAMRGTPPVRLQVCIGESEWLVLSVIDKDCYDVVRVHMAEMRGRLDALAERLNIDPQEHA